MIQELLGGGLVEDRKFKISVDEGLLIGAVTDGPPSCSSQSSATSSAAASPTTSTAAAATNSEPQNLRCPRCDSTNTKFCYYNNYNLTQPRHFCKTCRRYWTKGGALRNVPIGGGCRKTKGNGISIGTGKSGGGGGSKVKILASEVVVGNSGLAGSVGHGGGVTVFDQELPTGPVLWATPQNSHLLALLRATQRSGINNNTDSRNITAITIPNSSPNTNPNPVRIKEGGTLIGSHLVPEASLLRNALNARNCAGVDSLAPVPLGVSTSLWSNQYQYPHHHHDQQLPLQQQRQTQQQNGLLLLGEPPSSGFQELYQRLRSSGNHYADYLLGNVGNPSSSSSSSFSTAVAATTTATAATSATTIFDQTAVAGGDFGYWSSPFAWADMPTSNGAFL